MIARSICNLLKHTLVAIFAWCRGGPLCGPVLAVLGVIHEVVLVAIVGTAIEPEILKRLGRVPGSLRFERGQEVLEGICGESTSDVNHVRWFVQELLTLLSGVVDRWAVGQQRHGRDLMVLREVVRSQWRQTRLKYGHAMKWGKVNEGAAH